MEDYEDHLEEENGNEDNQKGVIGAVMEKAFLEVFRIENTKQGEDEGLIWVIRVKVLLVETILILHH